MDSKPPETYKFSKLSLDYNILIYFSIIALHIIASILVSNKNIINTIGNMLFYIPSDILIILVYKGIIKDRERK